jgi:cytochrome c biogenesis protein CcmG/thiol:disulfide interchange protein DsbE
MTMTTMIYSRAPTLLLAAMLTLFGCITGGGKSGSTNIPHLTLRDVDGKPHHLSDYVGQGKLTVMSFWATWCMPCRQELTVLDELYSKYSDKGLEVLAINVDGPETVSRVRPFVRQSGWGFPILLDSETKATALYNARKQMPCMHIFDADGRIVYTSTSFQPGQAGALKKKVRRLLKKQRAGEADEAEEQGKGKREPEGEG